MRALTHEQVAMLRGDYAGDPLPKDHPEMVRRLAIADSLIARGCMTRFVNEHDDGGGHHRTPLGDLALRVARPEQAFALP